MTQKTLCGIALRRSGRVSLKRPAAGGEFCEQDSFLRFGKRCPRIRVSDQRKEHEIMVKINGEEKALAGQNLLAYLQEAGFEPERVVVERNLEIVPKEQLAQVVIQDEDVIEVLRFVGGG